MATDSTRLMAAAALAVASCAVGILITRWTVDPPPPNRSAVDAPAQVDLAPLIAEIRRSNDAVLEAVSERPPTSAQPVGTREAALPDSDALGRLTAAIERNNTLLERTGSERGGHSATRERLMGPGYPSLDAMFIRMEQITGVGDPD